MTYVVRPGYVDDKTWDLNHRYVLYNRKGKRDHYSASLILLPDGSIITVFGIGDRSQLGLKKKNHFAPRDRGVVRWRLNPRPVNNDQTILNAAADSRTRNIF